MGKGSPGLLCLESPSLAFPSLVLSSLAQPVPECWNVDREGPELPLELRGPVFLFLLVQLSVYSEAKNIQINFHCKVKELLQWRITGLNVNIMS